jgi:hypothetical protein
MSAIITAPDTEHWEKLFKDGLTCRATYGLEICGAPAQWKIIMSCCGASDFMCAECFAEAQKFAPPTKADYFGCSSCSKLHPTWNAAVKESYRI